MADYVLARKSRNVASRIVHIFLNILLGLGAVAVTVVSGSPALGIILVLISKWRVFAVRTRYLGLNLKSNLVDFIVGISVVLLAYYAGNTFAVVHIVLATLYTIWLLFIKPLSSERAAFAQALVAVFLGMSATALATASLSSLTLSTTLAVLAAFLIGYAASRHVLVQARDADFTLTTLVCGLIFAEVAWICHSWAIVYTFGSTGIRIPQVAIILTIFAFVYNYVRRAAVLYQEDFRFRSILAPVIFGAVLIGIIVIWFSNPIFNI